jgi:hypothetical protein
MKNIVKLLDNIEELRNDIDGHIWSIFSKYIKIKGIRFNGPNYWEYLGSGINFIGEDGGQGCYDSMDIVIPIKFFVDPDKEFENLNSEIEAKKIMDENNKKTEKRKSELKTYEKLKIKYGDQ